MNKKAVPRKSLRWALPKSIVVHDDTWEIRTHAKDNGGEWHFVIDKHPADRWIKIGCLAECRIIENLYHEILELIITHYHNLRYQPHFIDNHDIFLMSHSEFQAVVRDFVATLKYNNLLNLKPRYAP